MNEADYFIVESHIKPAILEDPRITDNDAEEIAWNILTDLRLAGLIIKEDQE